MANHVYGHVGYGIVLKHSGENTGPSEYWEALKEELLPDCSLLKIDHHHVRGGRSEWEPLLVITPDIDHDHFSTYGITDSGDSADDIGLFVETVEQRRAEWDRLFAEFTEGCQKHGIELAETKPHALLYLNADEGIID